ncbi:MAG: hypothetical protein KKF26_01870 [Chloroflexi bacterium]|nr:hypothetical protein [Chloroflexota bacterium]
MRDKALDIFLMLFFALSGALILIMAFWQPMEVLDRILTIAIGSSGILGVAVRALVLKSARIREDTGSELLRVSFDDN